MGKLEKSGGCNCGGVRYHISGEMRPVSFCHCKQCQRATGHIVAATACSGQDISFENNDTLQWYESSAGIFRGFCNNCGSNLFWKPDGRDEWSIMAGTLDDTSGIDANVHIFVGDKADYFEITDELPKFIEYDK